MGSATCRSWREAVALKGRWLAASNEREKKKKDYAGGIAFCRTAFPAPRRNRLDNLKAQESVAAHESLTKSVLLTLRQTFRRTISGSIAIHFKLAARVHAVYPKYGQPLQYFIIYHLATTLSFMPFKVFESSKWNDFFSFRKYGIRLIFQGGVAGTPCISCVPLVTECR